MRRPAASPGRLLEASGDGRPREMVAAARRGWYRTRLIGLLPQSQNPRSRSGSPRAARFAFASLSRSRWSPTRIDEIALPDRVESLEATIPPGHDATRGFALPDGLPN